MNIDECKKYYDEVVDLLSKEIPPEDLENFTEKISMATDIHKYENNYIYVIVKDNLTRLMITKFYSRRMDEILQEISNQKMGIKFITEEEAKKENESNKNLISSIDPQTLERSNRKLRAEFTFDNFVIGDSNRFAFITAMKVAESPYSILNPLYMFGDVGLGKTHLMMAIGHYILDKNRNANDDILRKKTKSKSVKFLIYFVHIKKNSFFLYVSVFLIYHPERKISILPPINTGRSGTPYKLLTPLCNRDRTPLSVFTIFLNINALLKIFF